MDWYKKPYFRASGVVGVNKKVKASRIMLSWITESSAAVIGGGLGFAFFINNEMAGCKTGLKKHLKHKGCRGPAQACACFVRFSD